MSGKDDLTTPTRGRRCYTFSEAIALMKMIDKQPTQHTINWISCKTGKPVTIGYN